MKDLINSALYNSADDEFCIPGDEKGITAFALKKTVPYILKNELSEKQYECVRLFYYEGLSQYEVAERLCINQSTVSRYINSARNTIKRVLTYCLYSLNQANEQWLKVF